MDTKVINIKKSIITNMGYKDFNDWNSSPNNVYIGNKLPFIKNIKKSKWANPYPIIFYGREKSNEKYEQHILNNKKLYKELNELENKNLGLWNPTETNHGNVLIKLLKEKA